MIKRQKNRAGFEKSIYFLALMFLSLAYAPRLMAAADSSLYFNPAQFSYGAGENFSIKATIDPGANQVTAVELHLKFDGSKARLDSIDTSASAFSVILQAANIDNSSGIASVILGIPSSTPLVPVSSIAEVATFNFRSLGQVLPSNITFTGASQAAASGESGNVLASIEPMYSSVPVQKYNIAHLISLISDWMKSTSGLPGDVNTDGKANSKDLGIIMSNWE